MDLDKALQCGLRSGPRYGFRSGPTIWVTIRPYNIDYDQALQYGLRSDPTLWI